MFSAAAGYERYMGRWSRLLAPAFAAFAGVKDGERILDVGTGTGSLAQAVEAAFPEARVVGIDPSEAFVGYAKQRARGTFEVGNAQALRFDDASFDHSMSMLVLNFIPDHEKALAEMRRVTRTPPGVGTPYGTRVSAVNADGMIMTNWCSEMMTHEFGMDYISNGELRTKFIKPVLLGVQLHVKGKVKAVEKKNGGTLVTLDVWCEDEKGNKLVDGDAKVEVKN